MTNLVQLISELHIPQDKRNYCLADKYEYLNRMYNNGHHYILFNNSSVFGPFPAPDVPWTISNVEKVVIYNTEVAQVLNWVKTKIIINLCHIDYRTLDVLIRIATGMLNKCNIPKDVKIILHEHMVKNLREEHNNIMLSTLPF